MSRRAGYTLVEITVVAVLATLVIGKGVMLVREASKVGGRDSRQMVLEDHARLVLDRIAYALMGADRAALDPQNTVFPLHTSGLTYRVSLGIEGGEVVWSDPELISFEDDAEANRVVWLENPDEAGERRVVWSRLVRDLLEGEDVNGADDNGNGLVDEEGLSFVIEGNRITVRLSLGRQGEGGLQMRTVETTVTCRNLVEAP